MAKSCATVAALLCLFALSLADHTPSIEDEVSSQVIAHEEPVYLEMEFVSSPPLTKVSRRAINRHLPVRSKSLHQHLHKFNWETRRNKQISYGNDMAFSSGENSDFEDPMVYRRGRGRPISRRWLRLHHDHHSRRDGQDGDRIKHVAFDRERDFEVLKKLSKHLISQNEEAKKKWGFMRQVRRFLDHYF